MFTPSITDSHVKKLVTKICKTSIPIYIPVKPEAYAEALYCFPAVEEKIKREGGEMVLGWQIWKGNFLIEGEFHAIWKSTDNQLVDISQKQFPTEQILFLPDPKRQDTTKQVDNIRIPLTNNPLIHDFIDISKAKYRIMNKGDRATQFGEITLSGKDTETTEALLQIGMGVELMLNHGGSRNSPCFCGENLKYKHCHGKALAAGI